MSSNDDSTSFMTTSPRPPSPIFFSAGLPSPSEVTTFCKRGRFLFYSTGYIYLLSLKRGNQSVEISAFPFEAGQIDLHPQCTSSSSNALILEQLVARRLCRDFVQFTNFLSNYLDSVAGDSRERGRPQNDLSRALSCHQSASNC